jgi:hypothetical protein
MVDKRQPVPRKRKESLTVCVRFPNAEDYEKIREKARKRAMPVSTFLRAAAMEHPT